MCGRTIKFNLLHYSTSLYSSMLYLYACAASRSTKSSKRERAPSCHKSNKVSTRKTTSHNHSTRSIPLNNNHRIIHLHSRQRSLTKGYGSRLLSLPPSSSLAVSGSVQSSAIAPKVL